MEGKDFKEGKERICRKERKDLRKERKIRNYKQNVIQGF